jgi:diacylglycerol kinase (ATP)
VKICLIVNPAAGSAELFEQLQAPIAARECFTFRETTPEVLGDVLAEQAVREGFDVVAAAGGDGTVNAVVNGIMRAGGGAAFGIVPLGTGNDLARTLALTDDLRDAVALLETRSLVDFDVMKVETGSDVRYGINVAAGGFSGQVDEALTDELKAGWGPLAYLMGAAKVLPDLKGYRTEVAFDDDPPEVIDAVNVIVANGRTAAGGKRVAPLANPQDGLLDVVIVEWGTLAEIAEVGGRLLAGNYLDSPKVVHRRARRVHVAATPGMWFNVDGELLTNEPVTFTACPGALRVVVGTDFEPEPDEADVRSSNGR